MSSRDQLAWRCASALLALACDVPGERRMSSRDQLAWRCASAFALLAMACDVPERGIDG